MESDELSENMTVANIFDRWPATIPVFIRWRMDCVGCPMAKFMLLRDAMNIYELPAGEFMNDLRRAIHAKEEETEQT